MRIRLAFECDEPWESMRVEDGARRCARCDRRVVDLSQLTRTRARAILEEGTACVSFLETRSGRALVRPDPHRAGALVGVAAGLLAACSGSADAPHLGPEPSVSTATPTPSPAALPSPPGSAAEAPPVAEATPASAEDPTDCESDALDERAAADGDGVALADPPVRRVRGHIHRPPPPPPPPSAPAPTPQRVP